MGSILHGYSVNDATWFYLSLLLILAVFCRFNRVFSLRNFDLVLLLVIAPGLLLVRKEPSLGYVWMFVVTALMLVRLFCDSQLKRRPLLEANMNAAGMAFLAAAALTFLMTKVITEPPPKDGVELVHRSKELLNRQDIAPDDNESKEAQPGPTARLLAAPVSGLVGAVAAQEEDDSWAIEHIAARITAVLAHLAVVAGLWFMGKRLFGDSQTGLSMATLYLLLPCTALDVGKVTHVLPSALIVWAFVAYRNPLIAGGLMGLACGSLLFPLFLLPLWAAFYGRQGAGRFVLALGVVAAILLSSLLLTSADSYSFTKQIFGSIDWSKLKLNSDTVGFWGTNDSFYRRPVIVAFVMMLIGLTWLPREKNLEHLLGHSTAIIVATQLWYPQQGGTFVLWYLPLLLAVMFRPKLTGQTPPVIVPARTDEASLPDGSRVAAGSNWLGRRLR